MDTKTFSDKSPGKVIQISGQKDCEFAFIPNPLPPNWKWPEVLWPTLLNAHKELARLDGIGTILPNPLIIVRPLQKREAQRSSSLEGTIASEEQLALFEMDPKDETLSNGKISPAREVFNYMRALQHFTKKKDSLPISLRLIRELHEILLKGVSKPNVLVGNFRRGQVQIGQPARFVPPPVNDMVACLDDFEKYLHAKHQYDPLVDVFLTHYQFESIHPFTDGNGRVGRLLMAITIKEWCNLTNDWLYMSAYFDSQKDEYIDRLFRVSANGEWEAWIEFCLKGVITQAQDTQARCQKLIELRDRYHSLIAGSTNPRLRSIVDELFITPALTARNIMNRYKVKQPTARSDLEKLKELKILKSLDILKRRQKGYFCRDIYKVIYS